MRVVFAGTPPFAALALEALLAAGHTLELVLSQPDRPAGRGFKLTASAVARIARERGLRLFQPATLKAPEALSTLREADPDVMVVAAYGLILPQVVLDVPRKGCLNIHASLLPRWRGAAPVQRALLAGDRETGVCIMRMEAGLDTGPVLLEKRIAIADRDTAATLTARLAQLGAVAIVEALERLEGLEPSPQPEQGATYAAKVAKSEARIDWTQPSDRIDRQVRALNPVPGAETLWEGQPIKVWQAHPTEGQGFPGQILGQAGGGLRVACGAGALSLDELQRPGSRRLPAPEFLRGSTMAAGSRLGG